MTTDYGALLDDAEVLVASDADAVVGFAAVRVEVDALLLLNVAVSPAAQGAGIGGALLAHVETLARQRGLASVRLHTNEAMTENLARYGRMEYAETGRGVQDGFRRVFLEKWLAGAEGEDRAMPLIHFDLVEGRTPEQVRALLDTAHQAMLDAFEVPERDRYQVVTQHPAHEIVVQDTGLGLERSDQLVVVRVTSAKRTPEMKQKFYELLAQYLQRDCGLDPADLVVAVVENDQPDWSFGLGRAQFVTGEL